MNISASTLALLESSSVMTDAVRFHDRTRDSQSVLSTLVPAAKDALRAAIIDYCGALSRMCDDLGIDLEAEFHRLLREKSLFDFDAMRGTCQAVAVGPSLEALAEAAALRVVAVSSSSSSSSKAATDKSLLDKHREMILNSSFALSVADARGADAASHQAAMELFRSFALPSGSSVLSGGTTTHTASRDNLISMAGTPSTSVVATPTYVMQGMAGETRRTFGESIVSEMGFDHEAFPVVGTVGSGRPRASAGASIAPSGDAQDSSGGNFCSHSISMNSMGGASSSVPAFTTTPEANGESTGESEGIVPPGRDRVVLQQLQHTPPQPRRGHMQTLPSGPSMGNSRRDSAESPTYLCDEMSCVLPPAAMVARVPPHALPRGGVDGEGGDQGRLSCESSNTLSSNGVTPIIRSTRRRSDAAAAGGEGRDDSNDTSSIAGIMLTPDRFATRSATEANATAATLIGAQPQSQPQPAVGSTSTRDASRPGMHSLLERRASASQALSEGTARYHSPPASDTFGDSIFVRSGQLVTPQPRHLSSSMETLPTPSCISISGGAKPMDETQRPRPEAERGPDTTGGHQQQSQQSTTSTTTTTTTVTMATLTESVLAQAAASTAAATHNWNVSPGIVAREASDTYELPSLALSELTVAHDSPSRRYRGLALLQMAREARFQMMQLL